MRSERLGSWASVGRRKLCVAVVALLAGVTGCAHTGPFIWVDSLPPAPPQQSETYLIQGGDLLDIHVYNEDRVTGKARVRPDGRVTLPLLGDLLVRGKTPVGLAQEIEISLQRFIKEPVVTVGIDETHSLSVTVLGEVARPGVFVLPTNAGVMEALASAGGLTDFASRDAIFVLHRKASLRVRFSYDALLQSEPKSLGFVLLDGDVVAVE